MTTCKISALDAVYEMDGRKSRHIGEVLDWYRGEGAGDLKESNQKVVKDEKSWKTWKK